MRKPATIALLSTLLLAVSVGYALTHHGAVAPGAIGASLDVSSLQSDGVGLVSEIWDAF